MGEFELLARLRERLPPPGPRLRLGSGDDAAVSVPGGATATSVDALVEGVHFRREWASPAQIGHKALATALSDLAAMAAEPGEAYVFLGIPTDLDEDDCLELLDGLAELATATGTSLAGGDLSRSPVLTLAVTVVGHAERPDDLVRRSGARAGDALVVTGDLGGAAAGLLRLSENGPSLSLPLTVDSTENDELTTLVARQLEPTPRLEAGRLLAAAGATAMIDLSDGLAGDSRHLAAASGVGLRIDAASLPIAPGVAEVAKDVGRDAEELAASGGEDYELLAALPATSVDEAAAALAEVGLALTEIGEAVVGEGVEIRRPGGEPLRATGFDQLD